MRRNVTEWRKGCKRHALPSCYDCYYNRYRVNALTTGVQQSIGVAKNILRRNRVAIENRSIFERVTSGPAIVIRLDACDNTRCIVDSRTARHTIHRPAAQAIPIDPRAFPFAPTRHPYGGTPNRNVKRPSVSDQPDKFVARPRQNGSFSFLTSARLGLREPGTPIVAPGETARRTKSRLPPSRW